MIYFKIISFLLLSVLSGLLFAELRDPTRPADYTFVPNQQGAFDLSSIIISEHQRLAVINETILQVGDEILGNKVTAIDANTVQLEGGSGRITLFLMGNPIKKEVNNQQ